MTYSHDTNQNTYEPPLPVFTTGAPASQEYDDRARCEEQREEREDAVQAAIDALNARAAASKLQRLRIRIEHAELLFRAYMGMIARAVAGPSDKKNPQDTPFGMIRKLRGNIAQLKSEAQTVETTAKLSRHSNSPYSG
jgi:hypothetical protein